MDQERLTRQLRFLAEVDRLKQVLRRTRVIGESRLENSAEHSWHLAVMAGVLAEHAPGELDLRRTLEMLLVHDVVEIDAGDTFAFDRAANRDKEERERQAAERLFGLLPPDQAEWARGLWDEFEAMETLESRFANAMDRLGALLLNVRNGGGTWKEHAISRARILERMEPIREGAPGLWPWVLQAVDEAMGPGGEGG